jgi:UDP-N-acetylglucosamine:LPS N-acetylglucosamine transferase
MNIKRKIIGVCSGGGHLVQMMAIVKNTDLVFTDVITTVDLVNSKSDSTTFHKIVDCNVNQPFRIFICFVQLIFVLARLRPHCIVSTGAAPGGLALILGKAFRCKTIWIDSVANTKKASLTGKLVRPFCDVWISQWEQVASQNKGLYIGKSINIFNSR